MTVTTLVGTPDPDGPQDPFACDPYRPGWPVTPETGGVVDTTADDWGHWLVWLTVTDYATGTRSDVAMNPDEARAVATALTHAAGHVAGQTKEVR